MLVILIMGIAISMTSALFIMQCNKSNLIRVGNNRIEVIENYQKVYKWLPNETYIKQVKIKNFGTIPCYVRVLIVSSNDDYVESLNFAVDYIDNWYKNGDYYYYKKLLQPNETTTNLLESVTMANINSDHQEPFEIYVYAESIQSEGYNGALQAFSDIK